MIKTFLQRKVQVFTSGSYQTFTEGLILFLINIQNTDEEEILPNSFYEAGMTLTLKPHKDIKRKEHYRTISFMSTDINTLNRVLAN